MQWICLVRRALFFELSDVTFRPFKLQAYFRAKAAEKKVVGLLKNSNAPMNPYEKRRKALKIATLVIVAALFIFFVVAGIMGMSEDTLARTLYIPLYMVPCL